jgi:glycosyltransferase 2 family protein
VSPAVVSDGPPAVSKRSKWIYLVVSIVIAALLLYFSLRGIDWGRVWELMRSAHGRDSSILVLLFSVALFLRALRWRVLLSAQGEVHIGCAFHATSAGYLFNNVLPARAGELVRTMMVSRNAKISRTFVLTTAFMERAADAIALVTISGIVLALFSSGPDWLSKAALPVAGMGLAALIGISVLPMSRGLVFGLIRRLPVGETLGSRLEYLLRQVLNGVGSFHDVGRLSRFIGLTAVIWLLDATAAVLCASAIGLDLPFPLAMLLIAGLGLSSALPSTPGYVGIYQFVAVSILTPSGLSRSEAIAYILMWQVFSYVVYGLWGMLAIVRDRTPQPA